MRGKLLERFIIHYLDRNYGYYRYAIGKKNIGRLDQYSSSKNIYYLMAPAFGNVGDEAIVEATIHYLKDNFAEYSLIVIDYHETYQMLKEIQRIIEAEDIIVLQGGGNIGTLYYDAERMREFIINTFPNNKIISMPQSMFFSNNKAGYRKLKRCKRIYNSHGDLVLIAREKYTYERMKQEFPECKVLLNPDIVFYYSKVIKNKSHVNREGVMTCLRTDKEDILGEARSGLIRALFEKYPDLIIGDTCVPRNITAADREGEVLSLVNQFMKAKLVITDRLHGMVLAALTSTPCIVMPSTDKKVLGTYEWIRNLEYISFQENIDIEQVLVSADQMLCQSFDDYDWDLFRVKYFDDLRERIGV